MNALKLNDTDLVWNNGSSMPLPSNYSLSCGPGMIKRQQFDIYSLICIKCEDHEYVYDEFTCKDCGPGRWPNPDKLSCYELDPEYIHWDNTLTIMAIVISIFGIILTLIVFGIFIKYNTTPLVRASGRELTYIILFGIVLCHLNTFILIARPSYFICVTQRFSVGVGFSAIYGALLIKTIRVFRIFRSQSAQCLNYTRPKSQVIITCCLIAIQILITIIWLYIEPAETELYFPDRRQVILKCKVQDISLIFAESYIILLIIMCSVYAVKTRKITRNFNESKFIGNAIYTTILIWMMVIPIYFSTCHSFQAEIIALCFSISLSANNVLIFLFSKKMHILCNAEENVEEFRMKRLVL